MLDSFVHSEKLLDKSRGLDTTFLDGLRGLAALYVMLSHASYLLQSGILLRNDGRFVRSLSQVPPLEGDLLDRASMFFMYLFSFGLAPVMFFFVLSGFVIHLRTARSLQTKGAAATFGWWQFVMRRAKRLYPPLILAIVLTSILDYIALRHALPLHTHDTPYPFLNELFSKGGCRYTPGVLLGNLAFFMQIYVPQWGTDLPLWSLAYEWWFYMLYPLLWPLMRRSIWLATAAVGLLALWAAIPGALPIPLLKMVAMRMPIWWLGVLLAEIYVGRIRVRYWMLTPLMLLAPAWFVHRVPEGWRWLMVGLAFAGSISMGFWLTELGFKLRWLRALKWLGDMSYTLYITHMPIFVILSGMLMAKSAGGKVPANPWFMIVGIFTVMSFAYLAHFIVEKSFTTKSAKQQTVPVVPKVA